MPLSFGESRENQGKVGRTSVAGITELYRLDVHESVHCDTTMKITNKMHYID